MSFVREHIAEEDIVAYGLREINESFFVAGFANGWVIDRDRNIYLRWLRFYREEPSMMEFTFFWHNVLFDLHLVSSHPDDPTAERNTTWALVPPQPVLPAELEGCREAFLQDLRDALTAYGSFGMSSTANDHHAEFNF